MHFYQAFGLHIASEIELPEFLPDVSGAEPDVTIRRAPVRDVLYSPSAEYYDFQVEPQESFFYWLMAGTFAARNGNELLFDPVPDIEDKMLRLPITGTMMGMVLAQRGFLVLHASGVAIADESGQERTVAFLGWKGAGKSTMTATLYGRGHRLVSDDAIVVNCEGPEPMVYPGFPQLKLYPDSAQSALGDNPDDLPTLFADYAKRARQATERFSMEPVPLSRAYALEVLPEEDDGPPLRLEPLSPQEAVSQFITHSYSARFGNSLLRDKAGGEHFWRCVQVANAVPARRLQRRIDLNLLPDIAALVEADVLGTLDVS